MIDHAFLGLPTSVVHDDAFAKLKHWSWRVPSRLASSREIQRIPMERGLHEHFLALPTWCYKVAVTD